MQLEERFFSSEMLKEGGLRYYFHQPDGNEKLPLLIYLHGAGSRGQALSQMSRVGPLLRFDEGRLPKCIFAAPQCYGDTWFEMMGLLREFVHFCRENPAVDQSRVYLSGVSMGGYAAWMLAMMEPDWFAALVPVCGGGLYWNAARLKNMPIWAFHGDKDPSVLPEESLHMVAAVNAAGGHARLTLYPNTGHNAWTPAYADDNMWQWMFEQRKKAPEPKIKAPTEKKAHQGEAWG